MFLCSATWTAIFLKTAGGSVISFAGDAITCWFDEGDGAAACRAVACALAMQSAMVNFAAIPLPDGTTMPLALKTAVASVSVCRFVVGNPTIQRLDALAGDTITRMATAEHLARPGELIVDTPTVRRLPRRSKLWRVWF